MLENLEIKTKIKFDPSKVDSFYKLSASIVFFVFVVVIFVFLFRPEILGIVLGVSTFLAILALLLAFSHGALLDYVKKKALARSLNADPPATTDLDQGTSSNIDQDEKLKLPDGYDFPTLRDYILRKYGDDVGILVVQYGSTVTSSSTASSDTDFLVLVHGNLYEKEPAIISHGFEKIEHFDIHEQILDSFLFGAIIGKPFELSVARDGVVVETHAIDAVYLDWISTMVANLIYHPKYICEILSDDIKAYRINKKKFDAKGESFQSVVCMYWIVSMMIQIRELSALGPTCRSSDIYRVSKYRNLAEAIPDQSAREAYLRLCSYFKGSSENLDWAKAEESFRIVESSLVT